MSRLPSFGLLEIAILAGCAGLVLLIGAVVVVLFLNKRKQSLKRDGSSVRSNDMDQPAMEPPVQAAPRRRKGRVTILVILILIVLALPLLAVGFGILAVTPVRQVREPAMGEPDVAVVTVGEPPTGTLDLVATPTSVPGQMPSAVPTLDSGPSREGQRNFVDPGNTLSWAIVLPSVAGLALLAGGAGVALVVTVGNKGGLSLERGSHKSGRMPARTRMVILALLAWLALSAFLVLDLLYAISLSWRFVALYAAFWVLVGALLLHDQPLRIKLVVLALAVIVLLSVRFVNWTSRKPFLRDFRRIEEGMTPAQVDRMMADYMRERGGGPPDSDSQVEVNDRGEIVTGWITYRHTNADWGDKDRGIVAFEKGSVTETRFLPDR